MKLIMKNDIVEKPPFHALFLMHEVYKALLCSKKPGDTLSFLVCYLMESLFLSRFFLLFIAIDNSREYLYSYTDEMV